MYFSHCWDQVPNKRQDKGRKVYSSLQLEEIQSIKAGKAQWWESEVMHLIASAIKKQGEMTFKV